MINISKKILIVSTHVYYEINNVLSREEVLRKNVFCHFFFFFSENTSTHNNKLSRFAELRKLLSVIYYILTFFRVPFPDELCDYVSAILIISCRGKLRMEPEAQSEILRFISVRLVTRMLSKYNKNGLGKMRGTRGQNVK